VAYLKLIGQATHRSKQLVVARYKEDLGWLKGIENIPYIVYDKGNPKAEHHIPNIPSFHCQEFEGVKHAKSPTGRESHTYLYHIIKNYDQLPDMTIFLQGSPVEHHSNALNTLKHLFQNDFEGIYFLPLNFPLVICDKRGYSLHRGLPIERVFKRLFQGPCPELFAYSWGAMFCVSKAAIHNRPLAFYEEMMQIIYEEPLSGYIFERTWPVILGCPDYKSHLNYNLHDRSLWKLEL
jgi:hypothetical protein